MSDLSKLLRSLFCKEQREQIVRVHRSGSLLKSKRFWAKEQIPNPVLYMPPMYIHTYCLGTQLDLVGELTDMENLELLQPFAGIL